MSSRKGWSRVKFGDVVRNVSESVADPRDAGLERAVGLEHLDPGELGIVRWASTDDGLTFTRRFRAGQLLYGRRRVYQRKSAIPDFEGVCSGDIYVLEPIGDALLPDLLPFIVQSEAFQDHALRTSAGSLSPRTKWIDLAKYEFDLPPTEEQQRIAEFIWAAQNVVDAGAGELKALRTARSALVEQRLDTADGADAEFASLWIRSPESGCSAPPVDEDTGHFVLSLAALTPSGYRANQLKRVIPTKEMLAARLSKGDLLISRSNTREMVGFAAIYPENSADVSFPDTIMRLSVDPERVLPEYIETFLMSPRGRRQIQAVAAGTSASMKKINRRTLGQVRVVVPRLDVQRALIDELGDWRSTERSVLESRTRAQAVVERLREALLS